MLLGFLALIACGEEPSAPPAVGGEALLVEVQARVVDPRAPAAWSAQARWTSLAQTVGTRPGTCRRVDPTAPSHAVNGGEELVLGGPTGARLGWHAERGAYTAEGPLQALDPAWSVADVRWTDPAGVEHLAEDSVRFGGLPAITEVARNREGDVTLGWDPATVGEVEVLVSGPAGALTCGATAAGATLPWWAVPAWGGQVVLRSTREQTILVDGVLVRTRSTLERVIPLDVPAGTTAEEKEPRFRSYTPHGPRRLVRPPRATVG